MIENIKRLFINSIKESPHGAHIAKVPKDVSEIEYSLNSLGYRSKEFDGKSDLLFLGCSYTYGQGLPEENIWSTILSKKLNLECSSLAANGDSVMGQVSKAFYYFEKFGNPKIIVALFPFARIMTPYVKDKMETKNEFRRKLFREYESMPVIEYSETWDSWERYSKAPYDPQKILTNEFVFFYENIFIDMLRQYCKSNGIKFVWSNWDPEYQKNIYHEVNKFYPEHHQEYCYIDAFDWTINGSNDNGEPYPNNPDNYGEFNALDCHADHSRDHYLFYRAADRKNKSIPHWGTHKHLHIAENFYQYIINNNLV